MSVRSRRPRRQYTREILQAEADRFRPEADRQHEMLKALGMRPLPSLGFSVYTDAALHDAAIKAPPGFSAGYIAVGARSRSGRATVYVELAASDYAPNPYDLMYWQLRRHIYTSLALKAETRGTYPYPRSGIVDYGSGLAFVTQRDPNYETRMMEAERAAELARANDIGPWQTDSTRPKLGDLLHLPSRGPRSLSNTTRSLLVRETRKSPDKERTR